jgi:hypothetical protein
MSSAQANIRVRLAERQVARYREDVGDWQNEPDALARKCWPIEDMIARGLHYLSSILRLDDMVRDTDGFQDECSEEVEKEVTESVEEAVVAVRFNLREWLELSERILPDVRALELEYGRVEGAEQFREKIDEIRERLDSSHPITIDEHGRVFDHEGRRLCLPGLSAADIVRSLEQERAGRLVPLAD